MHCALRYLGRVFLLVGSQHAFLLHNLPASSISSCPSARTRALALARTHIHKAEESAAAFKLAAPAALSSSSSFSSASAASADLMNETFVAAIAGEAKALAQPTAKPAAARAAATTASCVDVTAESCIASAANKLATTPAAAAAAAAPVANAKARAEVWEPSPALIRSPPVYLDPKVIPPPPSAPRLGGEARSSADTTRRPCRRR